LELDASFTEITPLLEPAIAFNVTVPVTLVPPVTVVGLNVRPVTWKGFTVRTAVFDTPPTDAVIVVV
jgi:hypothetical protein